ncbi:hypothetical protein [Photobacterium leiognathi]|uniref:hypothetical protein n=1 Tax=Photobacterium leiognathi TaxID=553611 RepID=UPI0002088904|nr:hypothetical protein [Photobacterium leiognathi]GAA06662.1 hypothetical protein PMSV_2821 [Photobacterium leiognathi subsp. mandapamensis svers.1.1.]
MFYLYTISHSVSSSYVISRGCILVTNFFNSLNSDYTSSIKEVIFNHIVDFSDSFSSFNREQYLSLELINLILITSEFGYEYQFTESFLKDNLFFVEGDFTYFNIITLLYYIKNNSKYDNLKSEVIKSVDKKLMTCNSFSDSSHNIHLALDMISCPYIENNYRTKWLKKLSSVESLGIDDNKLVDAVSSLQNTPWFLNWKK